MRRHLPTVGLLLLCAMPALAEDDGCDPILQYAARNYTVDTYDLAVAQSFRKNYCTGNQARSGLDIGANFETIYEELPVKFKFNLGSKKESVSKTCEALYDDYRKNEARYHYASTVDAGSTDAWLGCKQLAREGIAFSPKLARTQIVIDVRKLGPNPAQVQGITVTPVSAMTCTVPNDDAKQDTSDATPNTRKSLTEQNWAITCIRNEQEDKLGWVYGSADISVKTSVSRSFVLPVPADAKPTFDWVSTIQTKTDELAAVQDQLRDENSKLQARAQALEEGLTRMKSNFKVSMHKFYTGERDQAGDNGTRYDPRNGPPQTFASQICGKATPYLTRIRTHGGHCCGYSYYNLVCASFE